MAYDLAHPGLPMLNASADKTGQPPSPAASDAQSTAGGRRTGVGRAIAVWVLIILTCLGLIGSVIGIWAHTLHFGTDRGVDTLGPLPQDPEVAAALSTRVSDDLVDALQIEQRARDRLPDRAGFLAPAIAEGARDLLFKRLDRLF